MQFAKRMVYDYELEYYTGCDGGIITDGNMTRFQPGEINIRKPG